MAASHGLQVQTKNWLLQISTFSRVYAAVLRLSVAIVVVSCKVMYRG